MDGKIRWGIIGPGKIAHSFVRDLKLVGDAELTAVASRSLEKASAFGREYNVANCFGSYEELFRSDTADVLYIATPHTSHAQLSIAAMNHGKHVLCEKPMGVSINEVRAMTDAARKNKVFLMEALWSRFNPSIRKVKQLVDEGAIGTVKFLRADFGFYALDRELSGRLLNPALAGGSLLDIGIYPAFLAYLFLGSPDRILSSSKFLENGVETQTAMILDYTGSQAQLYSGLTCHTGMEAEIGGSTGTIYLHPRWHETQGYSIRKDGQTTSYELPTLGKGYSHEIEEVHRCLRAGKTESDLWSLQNSTDLINLLDEVRRQNTIVFPFEE
jgi:predicted dehydrogenase